MPQIPIIQSKISPGFLELPRPDSSAATQGWKNISKIGESLNAIAEESQKQQDALDFANLSGEYKAGLEDLKEKVKEEPDFSKRTELYSQQAIDFQNNLLDRTQSRGVKSALQLEFAKSLPKRVIDVKTESLKEWNSNRLALLDSTEDLLADRIVRTTDNVEAENLKGMQRGLVQGFSTGPYAALNPLEAEKKIKGFEVKVAGKRADAALRADPEDFLTREQAGEFDRLDADVRSKLVDQAMARRDRAEKRLDQLHSTIARGQFNTVAGLANEGQLKLDTVVEPATGLTFRDTLEGKSAYIRPSEARQLWAMQNAPIIPGADATETVDDILSDFFIDQNAGRARLRLQDLRVAGTDSRTRREITQALEKVSVFQRVTTNKAEADAQRKMNDAIRQLKTEIPTPLTSFGKRMAEKKRQEGEKRIRQAVSERRDPMEAMQSYLSEVKKQPDAPLNATSKDRAVLKLMEE